MFRLSKLIAYFYAAMFGGVALWTWVVELVYLGSPREHMLPALVLTLVSMPSSLIIGFLVAWFPALLDSKLPLLAITSLCGLFQVALVWRAAILFSKKK